jgi:hypothetical protein
MNSMLHIFLAHELAAELRRDAERERLRRAALGAIPHTGKTRRFGLRIHLRWPRPWTPRPAG